MGAYKKSDVIIMMWRLAVVINQYWPLRDRPDPSAVPLPPILIHQTSAGGSWVVHKHFILSLSVISLSEEVLEYRIVDS